MPEEARLLSIVPAYDGRRKATFYFMGQYISVWSQEKESKEELRHAAISEFRSFLQVMQEVNIDTSEVRYI